MEQLINSLLVSGDLLHTLINVLVLFFAFDCLLGFASCIKSIKESLS